MDKEAREARAIDRVRKGRIVTGPEHVYDLQGESLGDWVRHFQTRRGFMELAANGERIRDLYTEWLDRDDLDEKIARVVADYERLRRLLGANSRFDIARGVLEGTFLLEPKMLERKAVREAFARLAEDQPEMLDALDAVVDRMIQSTMTLLAAYELHWIWLTQEIVEGFQGLVKARISDAEFITSSFLAHEQVPAPATVRPEFEDIPGESATARLKRWREHSRRVEQQLAEAMSVGPVPRKTRETYRRYGQWLYRTTLGGESNNDIARSEYPSDPHATDRTSGVRHGLRRARLLMSLGDKAIPAD